MTSTYSASAVDADADDADDDDDDDDDGDDDDGDDCIVYMHQSVRVASFEQVLCACIFLWQGA